MERLSHLIFARLASGWRRGQSQARGQFQAKGTISSLSCHRSTDGSTVTQNQILGPDDRQLSETGANSTTWTHTNAFANGQLLTTYSATGNSQTFALNDWQGTKRVQATANGEFSLSYASLPYGDNEVTSGSGPNATAQFFTDKVRDPETGNDYFGARYYNSEFGRWLSPDWSAKVEPVPYAKIGDPQSLDLYTYLLDNPLSSVDPDGHHCGVDAGQHGCVNSQDIPRHKGTGAQQQNGLSAKSHEAIGTASATFHYDVSAFIAALLAAGSKYKIDPNLLEGLGYPESSLNPSAKNGGLLQIQDPKAYGIAPGNIGSFGVQIPAAARVLSDNIGAFHGNVDLGIASWTLGVGGTRHLFSSGAMQAVRSAWLDRNHHDYGQVGPNYVDLIKGFEQ